MKVSVQRMKEDDVYRALVFAVGGCLVSVAMAGYYFTLFGLTFAVWYGTLAGYYLVLALARGVLLLSRRHGLRRGESGERLRLRDARGYLTSGALLVLLSLTFSGVLVLTVVQNAHFEYAGVTIYVAALYAFLKIGFAIGSLVRARKGNDFTVKALRSIGISDALVSIVSLQAAMLQTFTGEDPIDPFLMNAVTGGIAGVAILALGSFMIVRGYRRCLEEKGNRNEVQ